MAIFFNNNNNNPFLQFSNQRQMQSQPEKVIENEVKQGSRERTEEVKQQTASNVGTGSWNTQQIKDAGLKVPSEFFIGVYTNYYRFNPETISREFPDANIQTLADLKAAMDAKEADRGLATDQAAKEPAAKIDYQQLYEVNTVQLNLSQQPTIWVKSAPQTQGPGVVKTMVDTQAKAGSISFTTQQIKEAGLSVESEYFINLYSNYYRFNTEAIERDFPGSQIKDPKDLRQAIDKAKYDAYMKSQQAEYEAKLVGKGSWTTEAIKESGLEVPGEYFIGVYTNYYRFNPDAIKHDFPGKSIQSLADLKVAIDAKKATSAPAPAHEPPKQSVAPEVKPEVSQEVKPETKVEQELNLNPVQKEPEPITEPEPEPTPVVPAPEPEPEPEPTPEPEPEPTVNPFAQEEPDPTGTSINDSQDDSFNYKENNSKPFVLNGIENPFINRSENEETKVETELPEEPVVAEGTTETTKTEETTNADCREMIFDPEFFDPENANETQGTDGTQGVKGSENENKTQFEEELQDIVFYKLSSEEKYDYFQDLVNHLESEYNMSYDDILTIYSSVYDRINVEKDGNVNLKEVFDSVADTCRMTNILYNYTGLEKTDLVKSGLTELFTAAYANANEPENFVEQLKMFLEENHQALMSDDGSLSNIINDFIKAHPEADVAFDLLSVSVSSIEKSNQAISNTTDIMSNENWVMTFEKLIYDELKNSTGKASYEGYEVQTFNNTKHVPGFKEIATDLIKNDMLELTRDILGEDIDDTSLELLVQNLYTAFIQSTVQYNMEANELDVNNPEGFQYKASSKISFGESGSIKSDEQREIYNEIFNQTFDYLSKEFSPYATFSLEVSEYGTMSIKVDMASYNQEDFDALMENIYFEVYDIANMYGKDFGYTFGPNQADTYMGGKSYTSPTVTSRPPKFITDSSEMSWKNLLADYPDPAARTTQNAPAYAPRRSSQAGDGNNGDGTTPPDPFNTDDNHFRTAVAYTVEAITNNFDTVVSTFNLADVPSSKGLNVFANAYDIVTEASLLYHEISNGSATGESNAGHIIDIIADGLDTAHTFGLDVQLAERMAGKYGTRAVGHVIPLVSSYFVADDILTLGLYGLAWTTGDTGIQDFLNNYTQLGAFVGFAKVVNEDLSRGAANIGVFADMVVHQLNADDSYGLVESTKDEKQQIIQKTLELIEVYKRNGNNDEMVKDLVAWLHEFSDNEYYYRGDVPCADLGQILDRIYNDRTPDWNVYLYTTGDGQIKYMANGVTYDRQEEAYQAMLNLAKEKNTSASSIKFMFAAVGDKSMPESERDARIAQVQELYNSQDHSETNQLIKYMGAMADSNGKLTISADGKLYEGSFTTPLGFTYTTEKLNDNNFFGMVLQNGGGNDLRSLAYDLYSEGIFDSPEKAMASIQSSLYDYMSDSEVQFGISSDKLSEFIDNMYEKNGLMCIVTGNAANVGNDNRFYGYTLEGGGGNQLREYAKTLVASGAYETVTEACEAIAIHCGLKEGSGLLLSKQETQDMIRELITSDAVGLDFIINNLLEKIDLLKQNNQDASSYEELLNGVREQKSNFNQYERQIEAMREQVERFMNNKSIYGKMFDAAFNNLLSVMGEDMRSVNYDVNQSTVDNAQNAIETCKSAIAGYVYDSMDRDLERGYSWMQAFLRSCDRFDMAIRGLGNAQSIEDVYDLIDEMQEYEEDDMRHQYSFFADDEDYYDLSTHSNYGVDQNESNGRQEYTVEGYLNQKYYDAVNEISRFEQTYHITERDKDNDLYGFSPAIRQEYKALLDKAENAAKEIDQMNKEINDTELDLYTKIIEYRTGKCSQEEYDWAMERYRETYMKYKVYDDEHGLIVDPDGKIIQGNTWN